MPCWTEVDMESHGTVQASSFSLKTIICSNYHTKKRIYWTKLGMDNCIFFSFVKEDKSLAISWGQGAVSAWVDNLSCVFIIIISFFLSFFFFETNFSTIFLERNWLSCLYRWINIRNEYCIMYLSKDREEAEYLRFHCMHTALETR